MGPLPLGSGLLQPSYVHLAGMALDRPAFDCRFSYCPLELALPGRRECATIGGCISDSSSRKGPV